MRCLLIVAGLALLAPVFAAETDPLVNPAHRVAADDPAWRELTGGLRAQQAITAAFTENRWFPFRKVPTVLKGEVRVSAAHGLSLHYLQPQDQTVIIDDQGLLTRNASSDTIPPANPQAAAANSALLHVLRFDLGGLADTFEIYGQKTAAAWQLVLVPKDDALRRTLGRIAIEGEGTAVQRLEMRRSAVQRVEILIAPPQLGTGFSAEDLKRFFR